MLCSSDYTGKKMQVHEVHTWALREVKVHRPNTRLHKKGVLTSVLKLELKLSQMGQHSNAHPSSGSQRTGVWKHHSGCWDSSELLTSEQQTVLWFRRILCQGGLFALLQQQFYRLSKTQLPCWAGRFSISCIVYPEINCVQKEVTQSSTSCCYWFKYNTTEYSKCGINGRN